MFEDRHQAPQSAPAAKSQPTIGAAPSRDALLDRVRELHANLEKRNEELFVRLEALQRSTDPAAERQRCLITGDLEAVTKLLPVLKNAPVVVRALESAGRLDDARLVREDLDSTTRLAQREIFGQRTADPVVCGQPLLFAVQQLERTVRYAASDAGMPGLIR